MVPKLRWRDPVGQETAQETHTKLAEWAWNGLQDFQLDLVTSTLDGVDGDGKSAAFIIPILVLQEMARNPQDYPNLPYTSNPISLVITPTKGLSRNLVSDYVALSFVALTSGQTYSSASRYSRMALEAPNSPQYFLILTAKSEVLERVDGLSYRTSLSPSAHFSNRFATHLERNINEE